MKHEPKLPRSRAWYPWPGTGDAPLAKGLKRFVRDIAGAPGLLVNTSLDLVHDRGLTWHISVSRLLRVGDKFHGTHVNDAEVVIALRAFGMATAEEDNHAMPDGSAGKARHFWLEVDPSKRRDCECKETEETIVAPDGYSYTRPRP